MRGAPRPLAALVFASSLAPVAAVGDASLDAISPKLSVSASLRVRGELWDWFEPVGAANDDYAFGATLARGGLRWKEEAFEVAAEAQSTSLLELPDDASAPPPGGALGLGAVYFAHDRRVSDAGVFLKQGFLDWKRTGLTGASIKVGRFEFSDGLEVLTQEPTLDWLKTARLSQRLIGPFGWSHVGRAYDGVSGAWTRAPFNLTVLASHPTQGGFDLDGMDEIDDIDLLYGALTLTRPGFDSLGDGRLFYIYYGDGRDLLKSDNRPAEVRTADHQDIAIHTGGAHWVQVAPTANGPVDLLGWGAFQGGEWGALSHRAWAFDAEVGWQPAAVAAKPWVRVGFHRSSGDDDPADGDHGTFFQILPTARLYAFSTFYNLMNDQDLFVEIILRPMAGLVSRTEVHDVRLTEGRDLWYQGSGATLADRNVGFGFPGRPAFGRHDLFRVVETSLGYDWSKHLSTSVYYAHVFGGPVVNRIFEGEDANFGYLEATLKL